MLNYIPPFIFYLRPLIHNTSIRGERLPLGPFIELHCMEMCHSSLHVRIGQWVKDNPIA